MKTRFKTLLLMTVNCLLLTGFYSCSSDSEEPADNWNGELNLSTSASALRSLRAAPDDQIASGQKVGLFISEDVITPTVNYTPNLTYAANGSGGLTIVPVQYYPETGNGVKISGYHPHNTGIPDTYDFSVAADQSTDVPYYNSDLLYSAEASFTRQKAAHNLVFNHLLSKITYTLVQGNGTADLTGATVKIMNTLPTAAFDRKAGTVGAAKGTATNIVPNAGGTIIIPQIIAGGTKLIEVTLASGGKLYHTVETVGIAFESGKVYNYEITVNLTTISLTTTVKDWTPVGKQVTAEMDWL